jgi:hypothetical protein
MATISFKPFDHPLELYSFQSFTYTTGNGATFTNVDFNNFKIFWNSRTYDQLFSLRDHIDIFFSVTSQTHTHINTLSPWDNANNRFLAFTPAMVPNSFFSWGRPGHNVGDVGVNNGFILLTNLENTLDGGGNSGNNPVIITPLWNSDTRDIRMPGGPTNVNPPPNSRFINMPSVPGMSGSPVVECQITDAFVHCNHLGILQGENMILSNGQVVMRAIVHLN